MQLIHTGSVVWSRLLLASALVLVGACGDDTAGAGGGRPTTCDTDADCNDDDPCTTETCVESKCAFEEAPDGDAIASDQTPGDCAKIVCEGGIGVKVDDDGDIDDDHEPCTLDICQNGVPTHEAQIDQITCQVGVGFGTCADGVCIVPCSDFDGETVCDDLRPCTEDACLAGSCGHRPVEGLAPEQYQYEGDCIELVCVDGEDVEQPDDDDTPIGSNPCIVASCSSGEIFEDYVPEGQLSDIDPNPGDCTGYECDGNGNPTSAPDDTDTPEDENVCTIGTCEDGYPSYAYEPPETSCGNGDVCDGYGTCCEPITCADVSVECGKVQDGCNGYIDCGGCDDPAWCGGSGSSNSCGCSPYGQLGDYPGAGADDDAVGDVPWELPTHVVAYDGSTATVEGLGPRQQSHYLRTSDHELAVPSSATITGIQVTVYRNGDGGMVDRSVRIAKRGALVGTDKGVGTAWNGESSVVYGSSSDLWGTSWTPADVNDPGFGVALSVGYGEDSGEGSAYVDAAVIVVFIETECE
jgi:hypothetical protein